MAATYKVLGTQVTPGATITDLYTVPAGYQAVVSTLAITNVQATDITFRIAVVPSGQTLGNQHYIAYEVPLGNYESQYLTIGLSLNSGDKIKVYSSAATGAFSAFGTEIN